MKRLEEIKSHFTNDHCNRSALKLVYCFKAQVHPQWRDTGKKGEKQIEEEAPKKTETNFSSNG